MQQTQNQPTAAYWLSLVGGIIGLLASIGFIAFGAVLYNSIAQDPFPPGSYLASPIGIFNLGWTALLIYGIWMLITSVLIIIFARKLKANPVEHTKWGILIIIFSIIGVGTIIGLIGGVLALAYKPIIAQAPQSMPQQQYGPTP